jgi:hypothetical protein
MATKRRIYRTGIVGSYGGCAALAVRHDLLRQGANLRELAPG